MHEKIEEQYKTTLMAYPVYLPSVRRGMLLIQFPSHFAVLDPCNRNHAMITCKPFDSLGPNGAKKSCSILRSRSLVSNNFMSNLLNKFATVR